MIVINGIELPQETKAIRLEPAGQLDAAVYAYSAERDILIYFAPTLINIFVEEGMTEEEAWEWFYYNTLGTSAANYPVFIDHEKEEYP